MGKSYKTDNRNQRFEDSEWVDQQERETSKQKKKQHKQEHRQHRDDSDFSSSLYDD